MAITDVHPKRPLLAESTVFHDTGDLSANGAEAVLRVINVKAVTRGCLTTSTLPIRMAI